MHATTLRDQEACVLVAVVARWGCKVLHIFDQGFAGALWVEALLGLAVRFVVRWRRDFRLVDAEGNARLAWKIVQGKRGWSERWVWDSRRGFWAKASVLAVLVTHPEHREAPLSLVVCLSQGTASLVPVDQ